MDHKSLSRFWHNVDKRGPNECWEWTASRNRYGQIMIDGKMKRAHRVSWEIINGKIPPKKVICHTCDNPGCVNPKHLFLGTQKDNIQDAERKGRLFNPHRMKTHCKNGHPYSEENTRYYLDKNGFRCRECKTCRASSKRRHNENKRAG